MSKTIIMTAAVFLTLAVIIGAFGAHGLKTQLPEEMMLIYKTGVEYHFYHALGLMLIGVIAISFPSKLLKWSSILMCAGIVLFSGSLYILAITGIKWMGAVTPIGGLGFIAGWVLFFVSLLRK